MSTEAWAPDDTLPPRPRPPVAICSIAECREQVHANELCKDHNDLAWHREQRKIYLAGIGKRKSPARHE